MGGFCKGSPPACPYVPRPHGPLTSIPDERIISGRGSSQGNKRAFWYLADNPGKRAPRIVVFHVEGKDHRAVV